MIILPRRKRAPRTSTASLPAPVKGWNARDPLEDMEEGFAVTLDNWFPSTGDVMIRKGEIAHTTGGSDQIETLAAYHGASGTEKLWAFAGGNIYDVSSAGALPVATVSGLTNDRWQHTMFSTSAGQFLVVANGADSVRHYNGTTWATPAITNVASADLIHVCAFKQRLFFVEKNSTSIWYLPVNSVAGAAAELDYGSLFRLGGYVMACGTWTLDGGSGMDDHFVVVSSQGEVAVFQGTDPSSDFALIGVFRIGEPIGRRCLMKASADLIIITKDGFLPLSKAIISDRVNPTVALSDKIRTAVADAATSYSGNFGWQGINFPSGTMMLFNVPVTEGSLSHQYVVNNITGAWCRFKGWNANCFEVFNEELYYGGDGVVRKAWTGNEDVAGNIETYLKTAFSYFGKRGQEKHFKMVRPIFTLNGAIRPLIGLNTDYEDVTPTGSATYTYQSGGVYGTSVYGVGVYGGQMVTQKSWQSVRGVGFCAALAMKTQTSDITVKLSSIDYEFEVGGIL